MDILNTLKQLRDDIKIWVTNNLNHINTKINNKVDREEGKGLSTNDFTNDYKTKLDNFGELSGGGISKETDPTVPNWAKEPTKPNYIAAEVGALADTTTLADLPIDETHQTVSAEEKQRWNALVQKIEQLEAQLAGVEAQLSEI